MEMLAASSAVLAAICAPGLLLNFLVLVLTWKSRHLQTRYYSLIAHLAFCDMGLTMVSACMVHHWLYVHLRQTFVQSVLPVFLSQAVTNEETDFGCLLSSSLGFMFASMSLYTLVVIAYFLYVQITQPPSSWMKKNSDKTVICMLVFLWAKSAVDGGCCTILWSQAERVSSRTYCLYSTKTPGFLMYMLGTWIPLFSSVNGSYLYLLMKFK